MLKKSDLAKQFELVVQQEIKNYQDSLNFVLQSIKELQESVEHARAESLENYALIHSQHNDLAIQMQLIKKSQIESDKKLQSHINDFEVFKQKAINEIGMHAGRSIENSRKIEFNENQMQHTNGRLETVEDEIQSHSLTISTTLENMKFKLAKDFSKFKDELLSLPSQTESLRKEFDEKVDVNKVDVEGILKEVRINRKEMVIIEKKIENIYTLIERLKKSEVLP